MPWRHPTTEDPSPGWDPAAQLASISYLPMLAELRTEWSDVLKRAGDAGSIPPYFPNVRRDTFAMLRYVDVSAETVFNMLQMEPVLEDLAVIRSELQEAEVRLHVDVVIALARECASTPHTYLVFSPDDQPISAGP